MALVSECLVACYRVLLGREPDESAMVAWGSGEISGSVLQTILATIVESEEFSDKRVEFLERCRGVRMTDAVIHDHSQFGEVAILLRQIVAAGARHRIVVDVGANGRARSNSYDLLHQFGWRGLLIEANSARNSAIVQEFTGCSYELVNLAVSDYVGEGIFHIGVNDDVSSLVAETAGAWGEIRGRTRVQIERLPTILKAHHIPIDFDLLSIDAEGEDVRILNDTIAGGYHPRWVIIEASNNFAVTELNQLPLNDAVQSLYTIVDRTPANLILQTTATV